MAAGDPITSPEELYRRTENATATERGPWMGHRYRQDQLSGQDIYDRFIAPDERRRVGDIMSGLQQQRGQGAALARGLNRDKAARSGFGSRLREALGSSFDQAMAQREAQAARDAKEQLTAMNADPARFDVLRRASEAYQKRLNRDTIGNSVWSGIDSAVGTGFAAAGGPWAGLGAGLLAAGAGRSAHAGAILAGMAAEGAERYSPNNIDSLDLASLANSIGTGASGQRAVGFRGAGQQRGTAYRQALEDEYGGYG